MKIVIASRSGFCSGVERAVEMLYDALSKDKKVYMLGELIHNRRVINEFKEMGVEVVSSIPKDKDVFLITRSHGISPKIIEEVREQGLYLVDTTCPFVKRVQELAKFILKNGYELILVGDKGHAEIEAVLSRLSDLSMVKVIGSSEELKNFKPSTKKIGIVSQTTQSLDFFSQVVGTLSKHTQEMIVYNTICEETLARQKEVEELSGEVDVVVVIGGKNSANTNRLYNIAKKNCSRTLFIENKEELSKDLFKNNDTVLLVSGASTPYKFVEEVRDLLLEWNGEENK